MTNIQRVEITIELKYWDLDYSPIGQTDDKVTIVFAKSLEDARLVMGQLKELAK